MSAPTDCSMMSASLYEATMAMTENRAKTGIASSVRVHEQPHVFAADLFARCVHHDSALIDKKCAAAICLDDPCIVAHEQHRMPGRMQFAIALFAPLPEPDVANSKDLVEDQDLSHGAKRDGVGEPGGHPTRVMPELEVGESFEAGKRQNVVHPTLQLSKRQS